MKKILFSFTLLFLASCSTGPYRPYAREIKKKPGVEGIIALNPNYVEADRLYADQIMAKNCGEVKFNVLEEGEVSIGKSTSRNSETRKESGNTMGFGIKGLDFMSPGSSDEVNQSETSTTVAIKEWHINYECEKKILNSASVRKRK